MVLLHLLRRIAPAPLHVGHVDHRMRPGSDGDAAWLGGVCRAWSVPVSVCPLPESPSSETEARAARYAALEEIRRREGASFIVTAHHADDVAETVLLRAARGTGPHGLASILPHGEGRLRPLLPFTRGELEEYAAFVGLRWRTDPTNDSLDIPRNVVRHQVLPLLESAVSPGARRALSRLAENAADDRAAWSEVQGWIDERLAVEASDGKVSVDLAALEALGPALRGKAMTMWARRLGARLERSAVEVAQAFLTDGRSGQGVDLGGGVRFRIELDRAEFVVEADAGVDEPLVIESPVRGTGRARLGGRTIGVAWAAHSYALQRDSVPSGMEARFGIDGLAFPLVLRARRPGDRLLTPVGHKKVKKILLEARIPSEARDRVPILVDAHDDVVWIPGVARRWSTESEGRKLTVRIET